MIVKTYGVPGLSEWHGKLKVGSIETNVSFVGGTASPTGSQPAYMTTKDPIVQFVIENSKEYKQGFIIRLLTQEVAGVHPRMAVAKPEPVKGGQPKPTVTKDDAVPAGKPQGTVADETDEDEGLTVSDGQEEGEGAGSGAGVMTVEVPDKREAVEWLKEHYPEKGYNGNTLRSKEAFAAACKEAGVEFIIANA